jgi:hypothetical protein
MTHAALNQVDGSIRAVVHVHSARIRATCRDQLPTTRDDMLYAAPETWYEMILLHKRKPVGR